MGVMSDPIVRKAHTGEPGNPGQFGSIRHDDAGVQLLAPPSSMADILTEARHRADELGHEYTGTLSLITDQGTAVSEATLCVDCWSEDRAVELEFPSGSDWPGQAVWADSTENDQTRCVICDAGVGMSENQMLAEYEGLASIYGAGGTAGYTFQAENWSPRRILEEYYGQDLDGLRDDEVRDKAQRFIEALAHTQGVDMSDEHSYDSDDFPKVIRFDQLDPYEADTIRFLFEG